MLPLEGNAPWNIMEAWWTSWPPSLTRRHHWFTGFWCSNSCWLKNCRRRRNNSSLGWRLAFLQMIRRGGLWKLCCCVKLWLHQSLSCIEAVCDLHRHGEEGTWRVPAPLAPIISSRCGLSRIRRSRPWLEIKYYSIRLMSNALTTHAVVSLPFNYGPALHLPQPRISWWWSLSSW